MTLDIEKLKSITSEQAGYECSNDLFIMGKTIDYLHSRGYLGGVARKNDDEAMRDAFKSVYGIPMSAAFRQYDNEIVANAFIQGWKNAMIAAAPKGETK